MSNVGFVCPECGHRAQEAGTCPTCQDEALLDCTRPDVLQLLMEMDQRRRDRLEGWTRIGSVLLGIVLAILLVIVFPPISGLLPLPRFMNVVLLMVGVGGGCYFLLTRLIRVRPRFPWVEDVVAGGPS